MVGVGRHWDRERCTTNSAVKTLNAQPRNLGHNHQATFINSRQAGLDLKTNIGTEACQFCNTVVILISLIRKLLLVDDVCNMRHERGLISRQTNTMTFNNDKSPATRVQDNEASTDNELSYDVEDDPLESEGSLENNRISSLKLPGKFKISRIHEDSL